MRFTTCVYFSVALIAYGNAQATSSTIGIITPLPIIPVGPGTTSLPESLNTFLNPSSPLTTADTTEITTTPTSVPSTTVTAPTSDTTSITTVPSSSNSDTTPSTSGSGSGSPTILSTAPPATPTAAAVIVAPNLALGLVSCLLGVLAGF